MLNIVGLNWEIIFYTNFTASLVYLTRYLIHKICPFGDFCALLDELHVQKAKLYGIRYELCTTNVVAIMEHLLCFVVLYVLVVVLASFCKFLCSAVSLRRGLIRKVPNSVFSHYLYLWKNLPVDINLRKCGLRWFIMQMERFTSCLAFCALLNDCFTSVEREKRKVRISEWKPTRNHPIQHIDNGLYWWVVKKAFDVCDSIWWLELLACP